ncbi:hypothetical protein HDU92_008911 [Lobulomyces angularis]|nr:hypothetical protein HDU92_008911 [Lobulomyces angularis]
MIIKFAVINPRFSDNLWFRKRLTEEYCPGGVDRSAESSRKRETQCEKVISLSLKGATNPERNKITSEYRTGAGIEATTIVLRRFLKFHFWTGMNFYKEYVKLKNQLDNTKKCDPSYNALQEKTLNMLIKLRETKSDIMDSMEPRDFIPPSSYDVLLSDVKHNDLIGPIAERLGIVYLKEVATRTDSSTKGILYGKNAKPMVNLTIASTKHKRFINVIFLVDTGSPYLYICEKAMNALGFSDQCPETFDITFRDMTFEAVMSPLKQPNGEDGHYKDINLIGASFLSKVRAKFIVDYKINEVVLEFN